MAFNFLSKYFRLFNQFRTEINCTYYSTQQIKQSKSITTSLLQNKTVLPYLVDKHITFKPRCIDLQFTTQRTLVPLSKIIKCPTLTNFIIDDPSKNKIEIIDIIPNKISEIPINNNIIEKQAARLVIIRRKKMKKHKKQKFLRKYKVVIQKRELRRKQLKQNKFEAELKAMSVEAERFDAKTYVEERIELLTRVRLPNKWRGESLPEDMIRKFIDEKEKKMEYKRKLHTYRLKLK